MCIYYSFIYLFLATWSWKKLPPLPALSSLLFTRLFFSFSCYWNCSSLLFPLALTHRVPLPVFPLSGRTFMSSRSEAAYIGGICSLTRGGGINEASAAPSWSWMRQHESVKCWPVMPLQYGSVGPMAITLSQSLGQNIGMLRNKERSDAGENAGSRKFIVLLLVTL